MLDSAEKDCVFCKLDADRTVLASSSLAFAIYDKFPVNSGHALIIPKRHTANYFDLSVEEQQALFALLNEVKQQLVEIHSPDAFNVGINVGEAAGQTVGHVHIHLIPRYNGDMDNPRGGVRGVIPGQREY